MQSASAMAYSTVSMALRPPRVVVVFDGADRWTYWARRAQYLADQVWGGGGFALVPHRNGQVDPLLLRACRAYDPDYVVVCPITVGEVERFRPGSFRITGTDGKLLTGHEREQMFSMAKDQSAEIPPAEMAARDQVAEVCSPYRTKLGGGDSWHEDVHFLDAGHRTFHDAVSMEGVVPGSDLILAASALSVAACPPTWGGLLGALMTSFAGAVEAPDPAAGDPELSEQTLTELTLWLLGHPSGTAPDELRWNPPGGTAINLEPIPPAHVRSMAGLVTVVGPDTASPAGRRSGLLVVGDEPEDFALAKLWQLTFGFSVWLPSVLGVDQDSPPWPVTTGLANVVYRHEREWHRLVMTSVSRPIEQVMQMHDRLLQHADGSGTINVAETVSIAPSTGLPWAGQPRVALAVAQQFDTVVPVPTVVDDTGTRSMAAPLPPPILSTQYLVPPPDLAWHVDIGWRPSQMVRGRGLDGQEVFTADTEQLLTLGRASRHGISYRSHRYNWVITGMQDVNKLASPAVRDLSLSAWAEAKAREHGGTTRLSEAGHRAALLARMLGGRQQFVNLFSGPLLPALRALRPSSSTTTEAYPQGDGVSLTSQEGVLSFAGICSRALDLDEGQMRERLDAALRAGVLRRGLVLQCATCEEVQFQAIDKIGQTWACTRCDAANDLGRTAWRNPPTEPTWFYDLHPVGRHLLRENGEVAALLSDYLATERPKSSNFSDVPELEFVLAGQRQAEVDLIAYIDDTLTVAECKSTDRLAKANAGARDEVRKKCQAANWLCADRLVFATTAPAWINSVPGVIRDAVGTFTWGPLGPPEVLLITDLGTTAPMTIGLPVAAPSA